MRLLISAALIPAATALQTIFLATLSSSGRYGSYFAFFSDSNPCTDGVSFGSIQNQFRNCDQPLTILGHSNITFTGCPHPGNLPTGVADGGAPALKCKEQGGVDPPFPYGRCDGPKFYGFLGFVEYCS